MYRKWISVAAAAFVGIAALAALSGCGGGALGGNAGARAYLGTQAPGDVWDWSISNGTFTATNETRSFTYSGTEAPLQTGFMKLTIAATTDPNVTVGSAAYALELPNTALIIKPAGADTTPPIVACGLGSNPPGPVVAFNYVAVPNVGWTSADSAYGVATFDVTGNTYAGTITNITIAGVSLGDGQASFTCTNGTMTTGGGLKAAMTPSGVFILDAGPNNGGAIGVKQPAQDVDLADLASHTFRGFMVQAGKTQCIAATSNGDGTLQGQGYAAGNGVETGTSDGGSGVTVHFTSQPHHGQVLINLSTSGGSESLVASVSVVDGKYMIFGFGVGQDGKGYNIVLVQQ